MRYILVLLLSGVLCLAQDKSSNQWYFPVSNVLDFSTRPPTSRQGSKTLLDNGSAVLCDSATGALQLYTDGATIWNGSHVAIYDGLNPSRERNVSQPVLLVRQPGSQSLVHLFCSSSFGRTSARHYLIDMSAQAGVGAVVDSNKQLSKEHVIEQLAAVHSCDGLAYWIVYQLSAAGPRTFYAYKLDASGLDSVPIVSVCGTNHSGPNISSVGNMCFAPDGRQLASTSYRNAFQLFDFDNASGVISNARSLQVNSASLSYGLCFSQSGRYLYANSGWAGPADSIVRFDLHSSDIQGSRTIVGHSSEALGQMVRGPDSNIYVARWRSLELGLIRNPDAALPSYVDKAFIYNDGVSYYLPTFAQNISVPRYTGKEHTELFCAHSSLQLGIARQSGVEYNWQPALGLDNPSSAQPIVTLDSSIKYTLNLRLPNGCRIQQSIQLNVSPRPAYTLSTNTPNNTICVGSTAELRITSTALRSVLCLETKSQGATQLVSPSQSTRYHFELSDTNGCVWQDSILITVHKAKSVSIRTSALTNSDTLFMCRGEQLQLFSSDSAAVYLWSSGANTSSIIILSPGTVWLMTRDSLGCASYDTVYVSLRPSPAVSAGLDTLLCAGQLHRLNGSAPTAQIVRWTNINDTTTTLNNADVLRPDFKASVAKSYLCELFVQDSAGCSNRDTIKIEVVALPAASLEPAVSDTVVCACRGIELRSTLADAYQWYSDGKAMGGQTQRTLLVQSQGAYYVRVRNALGCENNSRTCNVTILPVEAEVAVSIRDSALDGEDVQLALRMHSTNLHACAIDSATAYMRFSIFPLAPQTAENAGYILRSAERIVPVRFAISSDDVIKPLKYVATLGAIDSTSIVIDSVVFDDCHVPTSAKSAHFQLAGVCRAAGTARLFYGPVVTMLVYPNPANDIAKLLVASSTTLSPVHFSLCDLMGRTRREFSLDEISPEQKQLSLDLEGLSAGHYTLEIQAGNVLQRQLIMIQH